MAGHTKLKPSPLRRGLFFFAQKILPSLLESVKESPHPPSLLLTGATAAVKGSSNFGTFAAGKFALRALGQSLAMEFGPQGVHVAHVIVDGVIDIPRTQAWTVNGGVEGGKLDPEAVSYEPILEHQKVAKLILVALGVDWGQLLASAHAAQVCVYT